MTNRKEKTWVHLIGICGVTMGPLAYMLKRMGWTVTGSDKGIFPPMSNYLKERNIEIELGFKKKHLKGEYYRKKYENFMQKNFPDIVIVNNFVGLNNIEYKYALDNSLDICSYPDILKRFIIKSNSLVIAGTYGKTTCTGLLTLIFKKANKDPSFMIGGIAKNFSDGIENNKGKWSIVEGDEYISSRFDPVSKFFHYKAEFLLLTACGWEHTDFFLSEDDYVKNFRKLVRSIPGNGLIVAKRNGENVLDVIKKARCKVITYELQKNKKSSQADWTNIPEKEKEGEVVITNKNTKEEFVVKTVLIGSHNKENILGCCALSRELNISIKDIQKSVKKYLGIARRLEIRYNGKHVKVIDDHACSPFKVKGSLKALRETFPDWHTTIIFEPNVGNRSHEALSLFTHVFNQADEVIIPRLKPIKTAEGVRRVSGQELTNYLKSVNVHASYMDDDSELIQYVSEKKEKKHIICFMGAYSFRNMIPAVIKAVK